MYILLQHLDGSLRIGPRWLASKQYVGPTAERCLEHSFCVLRPVI